MVRVFVSYRHSIPCCNKVLHNRCKQLQGIGQEKLYWLSVYATKWK